MNACARPLMRYPRRVSVLLRSRTSAAQTRVRGSCPPGKLDALSARLAAEGRGNNDAHRPPSCRLAMKILSTIVLAGSCLAMPAVHAADKATRPTEVHGVKLTSI